MPKFYRTKKGWRCSCDRYFGEGVTRAVAFQEWQDSFKRRGMQ